MGKKILVGFVALFVAMTLMNFVIHEVLLGATYRSEVMTPLMRPVGEGMLWIHFVTAAIVSYFFVLIFSKGYQGTGLGEGVRYGFYVGMIITIPMAYDMYAEMPIPYSLALRWFLYGLVQYIIMGVIAAKVFGKASPAASMMGVKTKEAATA